MIKNLKYLLIIFTILVFSFPNKIFAQYHSGDIAVVKNGFLTDLDGKVQKGNDENMDQTKIKNPNYSPTDYSLYPGYPVSSTYAIFNPKDGGIYCNMDSDPDMEIVYGSNNMLYARNLDTTSVPGWPKTYTQYYEVAWAPSFGDIDGDGQGEVVATAGGPLGGYLYAYKKDGTQIFSINVGKYPMTPVLADLDGDGAMEIIMGTRTGQVYVYKGDGTVYPGWPQNIDHYIAATPAVGDINNDGTKEVLAEGRNFLYVWDSNGNTMPGFPYPILDSTNGSTSYSAPVLADLFGDGNREIMFCSHSDSVGAGGVIYAVNNDGTSLSGWPQTIENWIYAPVSIADVTGDGQYNIVVGEYGSSPTPAFYLYAFNIDGTVVNNWPIGPLDGIACQAAFADLDNDGQLEVLLDRNAQDGDFGSYVAFNFDGSPVTGFPLQVDKTSSFNQPILADLNNDGTMDMVGGSFEYATTHQTNIFAWNTGIPYDPTMVFNPVYQYNDQHTGVFVDPSVVVPVELTSFTANVVNNNVNISWSTSTETNNAYFEIFRNNKKIAVVNGAGTTTQEKSYSYSDKNVQNGTYQYKLFQTDFDGTRKLAGKTEVDVNTTPNEFTLSQNYPNPFNPTTTIKYSIPSENYVTLKVYDVMGKEVKTLVNSKENAGIHQVNFDASNLASGVYYYRIAAGNFTAVKKLILMK